eukprot:TRINITY_DN9087_c0_g1_i1.p1 TRINITY_DN9087_c0_g1~~TRINITY_DN9087_c0_g1_i1.p1  ORF type:complete len:885 (-),score=157.07 TRINITY_DN9087_c0_g1_i1:68-2722(-)
MGRSADYDFGQVLGRGSFGVVHRVRRIKDGRTFVCKLIPLKTMTKKARDDANMEVTLLRKVSSGSDFIVQYIESFVAEDSLHIVMEFCEHGDLSCYLRGRGGALVPERTVWKFSIQIGLGLQWLHLNKILHRDMKTLNVFLTSSDDVRLGDLGVARVLSHGTQFANTFVGTPYYLSPEMCEEKPYNEKSDVWAYGCVIYEMCALRHPFEANNHAALLVKILRGRYAPVHTDFSDDLRDLIDCCMRRDFGARPTLTELLQMSSVKGWVEKLDLAQQHCARNGSGYDKAENGVGDGNARAAVPAATEDESPPTRRPLPTRGVAGRPPRSEGAVAAGPRGGVGRANARHGANVNVLPAGRRAPVEPVSRARVRGGSGVARRDDGGARKTQVIVAPPSSSAVNVIRGAQGGRAGAGHAGRGNVSPPPSGGHGGDGFGPSRRSAPKRESAAEERRRAAREVADLPDHVFPRAPRNAPTVHQLMQMDATASSTTTSEAGTGVNEEESTLSPEVLQQASELVGSAPSSTEGEMDIIEEATLLLAPPRVRSAVSGRPPLAPVTERATKQTGTLELSTVSAFDASIGADSLAYTVADSLAYTAADSLGYTAAESLACTAEGGGDDSEGECEGSRSVEISWVITDDSDGLNVSKQQRGEDEDDGADDLRGLVCDARWQNSGIAAEDKEEDEGCEEDSRDGDEAEQRSGCEDPEANSAEEEHVVEVIDEPSALEKEAEELLGLAPTIADPSQDAIVPSFAIVEPEAEPRTLSYGEPGPRPVLAAPRTRPQVVNQQLVLEKKVRKLDSQISRQYDEVVRDLNPASRGVWDELHQLFQSKMESDLTDEDQSEIERYIFESLTTDNTDLIWKVYKVLHLEQERDRCQKWLAGLAGSDS